MTEFVSVPGGRLAYDATGDGPPIVLMHAWICDRRMWDDSMPLFARRHRVVRYDKRGYGETEVTECVRYLNWVDVIAILDHVGIDRATLVGVSGGAVVALSGLALAVILRTAHIRTPGFSLAQRRSSTALGALSAPRRRVVS